MVDGGHDTTVGFACQCVVYRLVPLLNDTNFDDNRTLILLTFDETETYTVNNHTLALLLGSTVPESARGTIDSTYYTHHSLSTMVGSLGRGNTNKTLSNVHSFVANATGYTTSTWPSPISPPNASAVGAGGSPVYVASGVASFTAASAPARTRQPYCAAKDRAMAGPPRRDGVV
ncbi:hypothetical protein EDB87DRAFT_1684982 [Lactarius vividus]|nr:hypothetical protein EDB87DRAFT_1684982 [Lactarius vividus]